MMTTTAKGIDFQLKLFTVVKLATAEDACEMTKFAATVLCCVK